MEYDSRTYNTQLRYIFPIGIVLLTIVAYWNVHTFSFINFDDDLYVYGNPMTLHGLTYETVSWAVTSLEVYNWHPLAWISHMSDVELFGIDAGMHHATSVIIHIINSILLYIVFFVTTRTSWKSAFIAAVFALHPMHVESVAWVSERKDVLCMFFVLLALLSYVRFTRSRDSVSYLLTALFFAFALMSKPIAVVLPLLLIAFDIWPLWRMRFTSPPKENEGPSRHPVNWSMSFMEKAVLFLLSLSAGIVTIFAQSRGGAITTIETLTFWERIGHSIVSYVQYIGKIFYPANLSFFYTFDAGVGSFEVILSAILLLLVTSVAYAFARNHPYLLSGWLFFLFALVPVIGLLQAGAQAIADRYTYIPLIGIAVMVAWGTPAITARLKVPAILPAIAGFAAILILSWLTFEQVQVWKDNVSLYAHAIRINPANSIAYNNLGTHYLNRNELDSARLYFRGAARVNPRYATPSYNLGLVEQLSGNLTSAVEYYRRAISLKPDYPDALMNLGAAYSDLGEYQRAQETFRQASELMPASAQLYYHIGVLHYRKGELTKAAMILRGAIDLDPYRCEPYLAFARVLLAQSNASEAELILKRAKRVGCSEKDMQAVRDGAGQSMIDTVSRMNGGNRR